MPSDLWGAIDSDGNPTAKGTIPFTSRKHTDGVYELSFDPPLKSAPVLVGSICAFGGAPAHNGWVEFCDVTAQSARVITRDTDADKDSTSFAFIGMVAAP